MRAHMATAAMAAATGALLCACTTLPPAFQGTWYLQADGDNNPTLYIAVLNRGAENLKVKGLVVNSPGGRTAEGWGLELKAPVALAPGAMLVRRAKLFKQQGVAMPDCRLPVNIVILLTDGEAEISLAGPMPSALPTGWEECTASD